MPLRPFAALLVLCAALPACGGGRDATAKELDDLKGELTKLRADNAALAERLDAIEIARGSYKGGGGAPGSSPSASPAEDRPPLDVVRLVPPGSGPAADDTEDGGARPLIRSNGGAVVVEEPPPQARDPVAQRAYDQALELLRAGENDKALEAFAGFLVKYPDHPNADNATYWRGEAYLAKNDRQKAAEQFEGVVSGWPKGNKAPDALYALIQTYAALSEPKKAEQAKKKLLTTYPQSDAAKKLRRSGETPRDKPSTPPKKP